MEKKDRLKSHFDKLYSDGRALQYIAAYWSIAKTERYIKWLTEPCTNRTLKDCLWEAAEDFVQFAADSGQNAPTEHSGMRENPRNTLL